VHKIILFILNNSAALKQAKIALNKLNLLVD